MVKAKCTLKNRTLHTQEGSKTVNLMVNIAYTKQQDIPMRVISLMARKMEEEFYYKSQHYYKVQKVA